MVEEDGSVDSDFPPLILTDALSKYGFEMLAVMPAANQVGIAMKIE